MSTTESQRQACRRYYAKNRAARLALSKQWFQNNRQKWNAYMRARSAKKRAEKALSTQNPQ